MKHKTNLQGTTAQVLADASIRKDSKPRVPQQACRKAGPVLVFQDGINVAVIKSRKDAGQVLTPKRKPKRSGIHPEQFGRMAATAAVYMGRARSA